MTCRQIERIAAKSRLNACAGLCLVALALMSGCDGEKPAPAGETSVCDSPAVYMKDPVFRGKLADERAARNKIFAAREKLVSELARLEAAAKAARPEATPAEIRAELEKSAEYRSLVQRFNDTEAAIADSRAKTLATVRERLAQPAKKTSK